MNQMSFSEAEYFNKKRKVGWKIAKRPSKRKVIFKCTKELTDKKGESSVRAKVEHPFYWVKCFFGYSKVRYRGLDKNNNRLYMLWGFTNLLRRLHFELETAQSKATFYRINLCIVWTNAIRCVKMREINSF